MTLQCRIKTTTVTVVVKKKNKKKTQPTTDFLKELYCNTFIKSIGFKHRLMTYMVLSHSSALIVSSSVLTGVRLKRV